MHLCHNSIPLKCHRPIFIIKKAIETKKETHYSEDDKKKKKKEKILPLACLTLPPWPKDAEGNHEH